MTEKILCAAIYYKGLCENGIILCGHRHANIIKQLYVLTGKRSVKPDVGEYTQGFLTSAGRFVDREQAYKIAKEQNQILFPEYGKKILFSEHLY